MILFVKYFKIYMSYFEINSKFYIKKFSLDNISEKYIV